MRGLVARYLGACAGPGAAGYLGWHLKLATWVGYLGRVGSAAAGYLVARAGLVACWLLGLATWVPVWGLLGCPRGLVAGCLGWLLGCPCGAGCLGWLAWVLVRGLDLLVNSGACEGPGAVGLGWLLAWCCWLLGCPCGWVPVRRLVLFATLMPMPRLVPVRAPCSCARPAWVLVRGLDLLVNSGAREGPGAAGYLGWPVRGWLLGCPCGAWRGWFLECPCGPWCCWLAWVRVQGLGAAGYLGCLGAAGYLGWLLGCPRGAWCCRLLGSYCAWPCLAVGCLCGG